VQLSPFQDQIGEIPFGVILYDYTDTICVSSYWSHF